MHASLHCMRCYLTDRYVYIMGWAEWLCQWLATDWDRMITRARCMPLLHRWLNEVDLVVVIPLCLWLERRLGFRLMEEDASVVVIFDEMAWDD